MREGGCGRGSEVGDIECDGEERILSEDVGELVCYSSGQQVPALDGL